MYSSRSKPPVIALTHHHNIDTLDVDFILLHFLFENDNNLHVGKHKICVFRMQFVVLPSSIEKTEHRHKTRTFPHTKAQNHDKMF